MEFSEIKYKTNNQEYAQITKILGDGQVGLFCNDNEYRIGLLRGLIRRKLHLEIDDIVLVNLKEFEPIKCDVIHKYTNYESMYLKENGKLSKNIFVIYENNNY